MEAIRVSAKTVDDAITKALIELTTTSDKIDYKVIEKGSSGFLGLFGVKPAVIEVWVKEVKNQEEIKTKTEIVKEVKKETKKEIKDATKRTNLTVAKTPDVFLEQVCKAMGLTVAVDSEFNETDKTMNINLTGDDMGILIGKRGQTLDSLQYLAGLVANKGQEEYIRVKLDTENYRERRKETLENLAKNIAFKVKRTKRPVSLEPMNPYERRVIHSALQNDKFVVTRSEGEEPFRHVVISLKRERTYNGNNRQGNGRRNYGNNNRGNSYGNNNRYRSGNNNYGRRNSSYKDSRPGHDVSAKEDSSTQMETK